VDTLIKKLEAATEGSRELDAEVAVAAGLDKDTMCSMYLDWVRLNNANMINGHPGPHYTTSIDAALTLVPEGVAHWMIRSPKPWAKIWLHYDNTDNETYGDGATPALALCIAALKARMR